MKNVIKRVKSVKLQCVKVSKCGVFSGPYFPEFGLNTERYEVSSVRMRENTDQKKLRIWTLFTQSKHTETRHFQGKI